MRSTSENKKLIVISHPEKLHHEAEAINTLFQMGLKYFHLRKPHWKAEDIERLLREIPEKFHENIILHNHYELVKMYGLKGIHITQKTKNSGIEEKFEGYHTSISTHSEHEILLLDSSYDYAFISPVFNSITKKSYKSTFSKANLSKFFREATIHTQIIALGGINPYNMMHLQDTSFDGYAVLGYIWENFPQHPEKKDIQKRFNKLKKTIYEQRNRLAENSH